MTAKSEAHTNSTATTTAQQPTAGSAHGSSQLPTVGSAHGSSRQPTPSGAHGSSRQQTAGSAHGSSQQPTLNLPTGKAKWLMIVLLYLSTANVSFMQSSLNVALDKISTDYAITLSQANWVVLGYAIIVGTVITTAATLLKRFGIRKIMIACYVLSLAGSVLGAVAWSYPVLLVARVLQAAATGLAFPIVNDALLTLAPNGRAGLLLSINSCVIGAGLAVAPPISGLIITYWGIKALFLLPVAVSAVLLGSSFFLLHDLHQRAFKKIDAPSVVLSLAALGSFMYGLNEVTHQTLFSVALMGGAVVLTAVFVIRQKHLAEPLLNMAPLKVKEFTMGETLIMISYLASVYLSLLAPLYLEGADGQTPFIAGCMLMLPIVCYAAFCLVSGFVVGRRGVWPLVTVGFAVVLCGFGAMYFAAKAGSVLPFLVCVAIAYSGVGLLFPATKSADLEVLPRNIATHGSSLHSTFVQIAGSISSALFVGIMSSDVGSLMAHGASKAEAYSAGFTHTLLIAIGVLVVAVVFSVFYAKAVVKVSGTHE